MPTTTDIGVLCTIVVYNLTMRLSLSLYWSIYSGGYGGGSFNSGISGKICTCTHKNLQYTVIRIIYLYVCVTDIYFVLSKPAENLM